MNDWLFTPGLRFEQSALRTPVFPCLPSRSERPERLSPPAVTPSSRLSPKVFATAPRNDISPGLPLPFGACVPMESTFSRSSISGFVPYPGILTLSTVFSSIGLAGLFHPANALRLYLQGFPLSRSCANSSLAVAVLPLLRR